ncbi:MAG: hypothetical protein M3275_00105 [Thermoproteota archaeon]|nr:hypothetical protein [Thermoproteota archaeon]
MSSNSNDDDNNNNTNNTSEISRELAGETTFQPLTTLDSIQYIIEVVSKEVKQEPVLVRHILYAGFSTYTNDPVNLLVNSRKPGEGKSHPITRILSFFPQEDVVLLMGSSDKALFHLPGTLVKQNEETDRYEDIQPEIEALESEKLTEEANFQQIEEPTQEQRRDFKKATKILDSKIRQLKREASKLIKLENKILVFLDTPNTSLLEALMPLLSHDAYESKYRFTDTNRAGGTEATDNILQGWPTVILAQTLDISHKQRFPELARRFILVNPSTAPEKVEGAGDLAIDSFSLPDLAYQAEVVSDSEIEQVKDLILDLRRTFKEFSENLRTPDGKYDKRKSAVFVPYSEALKRALPKEDMTIDVTNIKRFGRFQTLSTITNVNQRPILKAYPSEEDASESSKLIEIPFVVFADTVKAMELIRDASNTGVRPEVMNWYYQVFEPKYNAEPGPKTKEIKEGKGRIKIVSEEQKALTVADLVKATKAEWHITVSSKQIREQFLAPLVNNSVIEQDTSEIKKSMNIYYPVASLAASGEEKEEESESKKLRRNDLRRNFIENGILYLPIFTGFVVKDTIKSRILRLQKYYADRGYRTKFFDGRGEKGTETELDSLVEIYYNDLDRDRVFKEIPKIVDLSTQSAVNSETIQNQENSQEVKGEIEKYMKPDEEASTKKNLEGERRNFFLSLVECNPQADVKVHTKTYGKRWEAVNQLLLQVDQLTAEGKSLHSLVIKDSAIAFDSEFFGDEAGGKLFQFGVVDVLTEKTLESIRITDPWIAGDYTKLVRAVATAIRKRVNRDPKTGYIIDDKEAINEQSFGWWTRGHGSDLDKIHQACNKVGIESPIDYVGDDNEPIILGQEHIDLHAIYNNNLIKNNIFKNAYRTLKLGHVSEKVVGLGKYKGVDGLEALTLSVEEQKQYNIQDCIVTAKLAKALDGGLLALMKVISELIIMPFADTCHSELPEWWAHLLELEGAKQVVDPATGGGEPYYWDYEGGLVKDPEKGQKTNIRVVDVGSLYPTMSRKYNIDSLTLNCSHEDCKNDPKCRVPKEVLISRDGTTYIEREYWICKKVKGIFPRYLDEFTDLRLGFKKEFKKTGKKIYDILATGLKIVLNGGYGNYGYRYFKFLDVRVAELITAYGRFTLRKIDEIASSKYQLRVIYGDTDSAFLEGENATNDEVIKKFIAEVNSSLNIELEDDKLFTRCVISSKKHYMGVFWNDKEKKWDIVVKGMEGGKVDRPPFVQRMWDQFEEDYLENRHPWPAIALELKKLVSRELPPQDFKFEVTIHKDPDDYAENDIKYKMAKLDNAKKGDLVWYYKIHNGDSDRVRKLEERDGGYQAHRNPANISYEKALETVINTFSDVLEHMGYSPTELFKSFVEEVPKDLTDPFQTTFRGRNDTGGKEEKKEAMTA